MFGRKRIVPTLIGAGTMFEGTLRIPGALHVDGRIDGTVSCDGVVTIGPRGQIRGEIEADTVEIAGRVEGRVAARAHLCMLPGGVLDGEATYRTLEVQSGGVLQGSSARRDAPREDEASVPLRVAELSGA